MGSAPGCPPRRARSRLGNAFSSAQTRNFLSPDLVLKGLQGETEEVLSGISLSVGVLKELYHTYDFCCANMRLFFKVRPDVRAGSGGDSARAPPAHVGVSGPSTASLLSPPLKDKEPVPWEFPSSLAFSRMNAFFRRIQTIEVQVTLGSGCP